MSCVIVREAPASSWSFSIASELSAVNSSIGKKLPVVNVDNTTADNYREDGRAIYGHIREGRGRAFGIEYQYTASGKTYGAQLIISYADGVLFRQLVEDVWSEWETIS